MAADKKRFAAIEIAISESIDRQYLPGTMGRYRRFVVVRCTNDVDWKPKRAIYDIVRRSISRRQSEDQMSDEKQPRARRVVPPAKAAANTVKPVAVPLPEPQPVVALPAPIRRPAPVGTEKLYAAYQETWTKIGQSQTVIASDVAALALEMSGLARANLTAATESMAALFGAKSLVEAVEIQLGFARKSLDTIATGSTRLGEFGLRLANEAAKPMMARFAT
jgi:hypothetical protein